MFASPQEMGEPPPLLLLLRQDAAQRGPLWRGEWRTIRPGGSARGIAPIPLQARDGLSAEPGRQSRSRRAGMPGDRATGGVFLW